jgi:hypothetical protein
MPIAADTLAVTRNVSPEYPDQSVATEAETIEYLADNGYPDHIVRGGRNGLLRRWSEFVREVEEGYRYRLEDYRNDLDLRGVIAILQLDGDPTVSAADERLRHMLRATDTRVWESMPGDAFWDFGYPRNASGQLLRDLALAGLAEPD